KVEIVNLVSSIGLEEVAAASYKDCCSIIARHPSTRANLEKIRDVEQWIDAGRVVEAITSSVEIVPAYEGRSEDARERASRRFFVDMPSVAVTPDPSPSGSGENPRDVFPSLLVGRG